MPRGILGDEPPQEPENRIMPEGFDSKRQPLHEINPQEIYDAIQSQAIISMTVTHVIGTDIYVMLGTNGVGATVFGVMPAAEFDDKLYAGYEGFVGEVVDALITGYDPERQLATVSRRRARAIKREQLLKQVGVGSIVVGVVKAIREFGAFVDIGGLHAILPVNEISHSYVKEPKDVLKRGDVLNVKIIDCDKENLKVRVSLKAMTDPWPLYVQHMILLGAISGLRGEQVWVRPEPYHGLEILCPAIPTVKYRTGERVRVKLVTVDKGANKLRGRIIGTVA